MTQLETRTEPMVLNFGPHHPSMHGVLRLVVTLDGEDVVDCEPVTSRKQDPDGHGYYCLNDTVRQDVLAVLSGQAPVDIKSRRYLPELRTYRLKKA